MDFSNLAALEENYLTSGAARTKQQQQPKKKQRGLLASLLPMIGGGLGAIGGSFVAPVAGTAAGGAAGSALGEFLAQKLSGEDTNVGKMTLEGVLGAVPGAGKLVSGARAAKGANAARTAVAGAGDAGRLGRIGNSLRANSSGMRQSGNILPSATERASVQSTFETAGLSGSAKSKFDQVDSVIGRLGKSADEIYAQTTAKVSPERFMKNLNIRAGKELPSDTTAFQAGLKQVQEKLFNYTDETGKLTATGLNKFKRDISGRLDSAWKKQRMGTTLAPQEEALLTAWGTVDDALINMAPNAKRLTKAQSELLKGRAVLDKAQGSQGQIFGLNTEGANQLNQAVQDFMGKNLQKVDRFGKTLPGRVAGATAAQGATRAGAAVLGVGAQPSDAGMPEDPNAAMSMEELYGGIPDDVAQQLYGEVSSKLGGGAIGELGATPGDSTAGYNLSRDAITQALMEDMQTTGGKNMDALITLYEFANPEGDSKQSAAASKAITTMDNATSRLDQLESLFYDAGGGQGLVGGVSANIRGKLRLDDNAKSYNDMRGSAATLIARALGEVGTMTDQDIQRALGNLPDLTDTPGSARTKLQTLRTILQDVRQNNMNSGGGGGMDMEQAMMMMGAM